MSGYTPMAAGITRVTTALAQAPATNAGRDTVANLRGIHTGRADGSADGTRRADRAEAMTAQRNTTSEAPYKSLLMIRPGDLRRQAGIARANFL